MSRSTTEMIGGLILIRNHLSNLGGNKDLHPLYSTMHCILLWHVENEWTGISSPSNHNKYESESSYWYTQGDCEWTTYGLSRHRRQPLPGWQLASLWHGGGPWMIHLRSPWGFTSSDLDEDQTPIVEIGNCLLEINLPYFTFHDPGARMDAQM